MAVTVQDVATTLRRGITDPREVAAIELWLHQAVMQIRLRFGDRAAELDIEAVDYAVLESVAARFRTPTDAAASMSWQVDDAQITKRWEQSAGSGAMPDEWLDWLAGTLPGAGASEAFSINLWHGGGGRCAW